MDMDLLMTIAGLCGDARKPLRFAGIIITAFKVLIPLIIIILGIFDLGRAAIGTKPEDIKNAAVGLIWRLVGGIVIFFLPSIVILFMNLVGDFQNETKHPDIEWKTCETCLLHPSDCPV